MCSRSRAFRSAAAIATLTIVSACAAYQPGPPDATVVEAGLTDVFQVPSIRNDPTVIVSFSEPYAGQLAFGMISFDTRHVTRSEVENAAAVTCANLGKAPVHIQISERERRGGGAVLNAAYHYRCADGSAEDQQALAKLQADEERTAAAAAAARKDALLQGVLEEGDRQRRVWEEIQRRDEQRDLLVVPN